MLCFQQAMEEKVMKYVIWSWLGLIHGTGPKHIKIHAARLIYMRQNRNVMHNGMILDISRKYRET